MDADVVEIDPYLQDHREPSLLERLGLRLWDEVPDDVRKQRRLRDQQARMFQRPEGEVYVDTYRD
jgi:hypothetical protein